MKSRLVWAVVLVAAIAGFYFATIRPALRERPAKPDHRRINRDFATSFQPPPIPPPVPNDAFLAAAQPAPDRLFAFTTKGSHSVFAQAFRPGDWLVFGSETRGLAPELRERFPPAQRLRLPMLAGQRSLNLSNAVAVSVFEAWRQNGFAQAQLGADPA